MSRPLLIPALIALSVQTAEAAECTMQSAEHLVPVVELFTSEGCSSCPPADRWLSGLSGEMRSSPLSVLAYHVDYWDYIGWRDRFADPAHGRRHQRHVAASGGRIRYTPRYSSMVANTRRGAMELDLPPTSSLN